MGMERLTFDDDAWELAARDWVATVRGVEQATRGRREGNCCIERLILKFSVVAKWSVILIAILRQLMG